MKKIGIFRGSFDPITNEHISYASRQMKKQNLQQIWFCLEDDDHLTDYQHRFNLVNRALKPYRKMKPVNKPYVHKEACFVELTEDQNLKSFSEGVKEGQFRYLPDNIKTYVVESGIYAASIVHNLVNEHRYQHSLSVAQLACRLAQCHHLDSYKAYLIGIYHDIAKGMSEEELTAWTRIEQPYELAYPSAVWHQYVGAYYLKHVMSMKDETMLKAIRHHCLGDDDSPYSKIIFIADKLDPSRGYDSSKEIQLAEKDLEKAFRLVHQQQAEYLQKEK